MTHVFVEVTNTLAVAYVTGFQRHTRELLARLPGPDDGGPLHFVPVVWCAECDDLRRLTAEEADRLARFRPPGTPTRSRLSVLGDRLPGPVRDTARRLVRTPAAHRLRERAAAERRRRAHPPGHAALCVGRPPADAWLFDLEAAWHNLPRRDELLPRLHARGYRTSTLVADVMPMQFPQWFDAGQQRLFGSFMEAHFRHSERFVAISRCSERDATQVAAARGFGPLDTSVITMGADFRRAADDLPRPAEAPPGRYVISVATVEPRKNHGLLVDAFDRLADAHPDLSVCFVGKAGWMTDDLQARLRSHPLAGGRFRWLDRVDDDLLDALYRHAFVAVQPAFYEGFGTPVIEALGNGIPTLSSNGGALPEAGGEWAEYFDPTDLDALVALLERHLADPAHHEAARARLVDYRPPSWEDGARGIVDAFSR